MTDKMQVAVVYRVVKEINKPTDHGENKYTFDLSYTGHGCLAVSVDNIETKKLNKLFSKGDIRWYSTYGSYISFHNNANLAMFCGGDVLQYTIIRQPFIHRLLLLPRQEGMLYQRAWYVPHGIAKCKSGDILLCLWNRLFGKRSHGIVLKLPAFEEPVLEIESNKNRRLFTCPTYVIENGNEDVFVSDADDVVVTDKLGMLRFRYKGRPGDPQFDPYGICCDSRCSIITADMKNHKIHVIDQDGGFLHYIQYNGMKRPRALCIDENDQLYVGEWDSDVIKVISR
jgi:hypothetical protein